MAKQKPDAAVIRELAVAASVDPRTLRKALVGAVVRGMPGHRARKVLAAAGLLLAEQEKAPLNPNR
jgi:hypothetical protein